MSNSMSFWQRIRRTPYQAIGAVFMIFITLFVIAVFLLLAGISSAVISYFETKPQLTVFFKDEKSRTSIDQLIGKLEISGKVSNIQYISKEQALAIYREQNKNDPLLLEMVSADILPSSLEVSAISPKFLVELNEILQKEPEIDEIVFQKDIVESLITWTSTIRLVGIVSILFLLFTTFFILLTSIGMKIALRKEEIEILKLVGATSWYVKKPFILEGISYGLTGALLSCLSVSALVLYLRPFITSFLSGISKLYLWQNQYASIEIWPPTVKLFAILWFVLLAIGTVIGFVGSLFAASRYMKH